MPRDILENVEPLRAAQYVRMSTDRQIYSTVNQMDAIATYALRKGITIVRTYQDDGRSGLLLDRRPALKSLLSDVMFGKADFDIILVYDVSRWGRFQNSDQSAHYEFMCKEAGVQVEYCAEEFSNDGSLMSNVIKGLKRAMAAEYSRELSNKVFAAQCRLAKNGFHHGGACPYGMRRMLINQNGKPKGLLEPGQRKHLQTDHVVLQPGPENEILVVREIFKQYVHEGKSESKIARYLNQEGILIRNKHQWTHQTVRRALDNEAYVGANVYNRKTCRLGSKMRNNSPDVWVRRSGAFEAIIEQDLFDQARQDRKRRRLNLSNAEMLSRLEALVRQKGRLSATLVDEAEDLPSNATYIRRFGSLREAYRLIKYRHRANFRYVDRGLFYTAKIKEVAAEIATLVEKSEGSASFDELAAEVTINNTVIVSIYIARCNRVPGGGLCWKLHRRKSLRGDWLIALRPDFLGRKIIDYLLLPVPGFPMKAADLSDRNLVRLAACAHKNVAALFPKLLEPPKDKYVRLIPHSSTRCGVAKLDHLPAKRRHPRRSARAR